MRGTLYTVSLWFMVACTSAPSTSRDAGLADGAAGAPGSIGSGVPFAGFDAAIPVCANLRPAADAGPVPQRDCGAGPSVSFRNDIQPLLATHCTGEVCHESSWASSKNEYADLVNAPTPECCDGRKRIDPVHPDSSYLLQKLRGVDLCAGRRMPLSGSITDAQIAEIARWVCQGAADD